MSLLPNISKIILDEQHQKNLHRDECYTIFRTGANTARTPCKDDYNSSLSQESDDKSDLDDNDDDGLGAQLETALQAGGDWGDGCLL